MWGIITYTSSPNSLGFPSTSKSSTHRWDFCIHASILSRTVTPDQGLSWRAPEAIRAGKFCQPLGCQIHLIPHHRSLIRRPKWFTTTILTMRFYTTQQGSWNSLVLRSVLPWLIDRTRSSWSLLIYFSNAVDSDLSERECSKCTFKTPDLRTCFQGEFVRLQ